MFDRWRRGASGAAVAESATRLLLVLLLLAPALRRAGGQTTVDGAIRGVATDQAAAAVSGALVRVEDAGRGLVFTAKCGAHGDLLLAHLPAGAYAVTISAPGFATLALDRVTVEAGGTAELEIRLKVAGVRTMVTVTDDASEGVAGVEQPSGAAIAGVISSSEMDALPINGQRWQSLALLTPAANVGEQGEGLLSFRGRAVTENSTTVDGMDDDQSFNAVPRGAESVDDGESEEETGVEPGGAWRSAGSWRRSGAAYTFSQVAVREFRVSTQNYSALYGHGAGGVIATISKSGTNDLHGSVFYRVRTSAWAATNPFSIATRYRDGAITSGYVKPHDLRQQFGGTVGGRWCATALLFLRLRSAAPGGCGDLDSGRHWPSTR
ncbi:carboxypeptidase-like regulatory domain-containing protein [Edaphobacter aggregans]|uniref:carboxypeptidase-like regulatory domain-containing protein n=1 Tax=Edaphobacter aggregans TaxID=570835 RepID=UPI00069119DF|nr:carboxypeptidase-like regulatory domain-containing protein [Edaphobacter aggregans]